MEEINRTPSLPAPPMQTTPTERWTQVITEFATTIGKTFDEVTATLVENAVNSTDDVGLAVLSNQQSMPDALWAELFPKPGVKTPMLNSAVNNLRSALRPQVTEVARATAQPSMGSAIPILPQLPTEPSAFDRLIVGGTLDENVKPIDAVTAIEAALAEDIGLPRVPERLVSLIETFAGQRKKRVLDAGGIYKLIKEIKRRRYSDVLSAMDLDANIVTKDEREQFMQRMRTVFWPALVQHWTGLHAWFEAQRVNGMDVNALAQGLMSAMVGRPNFAQQPIEIESLRSLTTLISDATNELFSGLYTFPVVNALAGDALRVSSYLDSTNPMFVRILSATGLPDREALLQDSGASVTDTFVRNKRTVQEYVYAALEMRNKSDDQLVDYANALHTRGMSVPWNDLGRQSINSAQPKNEVATSRREVRGKDVADPRYQPWNRNS